MDLGCQNGTKLAPKWNQKSLFTWKGDFSKFVLWLQRGRSPEDTPSDGPMGYPLGIDCKNGIQVGMHLGIDFSLILMVFGRQVGRQNGPKIDPWRSIGFGRCWHCFWKGFGGVSPRPGHPGAEIDRPPKSRFFKTDQTPLELGMG